MFFRVSSKTLLTTLLLTTGCASTSFSEKTHANRNYPKASDSPLAENNYVKKEILEADAAIESPQRALHSTFSIPIEINENVNKWIRFFTETNRTRFSRFLTRGEKYRPIVQKILRENGVPEELYYLAMIESGFVVNAKSHAHAVGIWQFMSGTGLRYGLQKNRYIDERLDVIRATKAAASYLKNLHTAFQSWYLAMAGYNAGEGRILGAIMRGQTRDFWKLVENKALPPETRNYVPKFLAAAIIGKNPKEFGFNNIDAPEFPEFTMARVPGGLKLYDIAKTIGIPYLTLKHLNPHLIRGYTPPSEANYQIWIPIEANEKFIASADLISKLKRKNFVASAPSKSVYVVRRGDSLGAIAKRYKISILALKQRNGLRTNTIAIGRRLKLPNSIRSTNARQVIYHRVRKGEVLFHISQKYDVPVKKIKKMNDLKSNRIYVGQRLLISGSI